MRSKYVSRYQSTRLRDGYANTLQRHKLVKGCGSKADAAAKEDGARSDSGSDDVDQSPVVAVTA